MIRDINRPLLYRLVKIHNLLKSKKYASIAEMSEACGMSERNTARDIQTMRNDLGLELAFNKEIGKYHYETETADLRIPPIKFTAGELFAIFMAEKILPQLDKKLRTTLDNVLNKIRFLASEQTNVTVGELSELFSIDLRAMSELCDKNDALIKKAMKTNKTLNITYYSPHNREETTREFEPYTMHFTFGNWYLIGRCRLRNDLRTLSVDNIRCLEITANTFTKPKDFSVDQYMGKAWGIVKGKTQAVEIKFSATIADWVKSKKWAQDQKHIQLKDGSVVMKFTVDGLDEIARWVLSFGEKATVLSPIELKTMVVDKAKAILKNNK